MSRACPSAGPSTPYQGCVHGCHYCFARSFNLRRDLDPGEDFTGLIGVKVNAPEVLSRELSRPAWRRETVAVGTATDPYQPIEGKYRITRRCLEAFATWRTPVSLITKGSMAVRDADVMADLARRAGCTVCFSITTLDADLARRLEPGTPPPIKRLATMVKLVDVGVNAGVLIAPIVPGVTDAPASLEAVARAAADHGARWLGGNVLNLKIGTKEHFMGFLEAQYPALLSEYARLYPGGFAPRRFQGQVQARVEDLAHAYGLRPRGDDAGPRQLALALP